MNMVRRGFTLVELLVVIAIIAILAGLLLPALAGAREHAKRTRAQTEMKLLQTAVSMYESDYGVLPVSRTPPPTNTDSEALTTAEFDSLIAHLQGANPRQKRYLETDTEEGPGVYRDPWRNSYRAAMDLNYDGQINASASEGPFELVYGRVAVWSWGKDKAEDYGAEGDVNSWRR